VPKVARWVLIVTGWRHAVPDAPLRWEASVGLQKLAVDPGTLFGEKKRHHIGYVGWGSEAAGGLACEAGRTGGVVHPAGINWARIDQVGSDLQGSELASRGKDDAVQRSLARSIGQIPHGGIAGESHDASSTGRYLQCELANELPTGASVHRKMTIEALERGVEDIGIDRLAVREDQSRYWAVRFAGSGHERLSSGRIFQVGGMRSYARPLTIVP